MTKKCPVCHAMIAESDGGVCPGCGGKVASSFWGMSEEERASYVRKLAQAMRERRSPQASGGLAASTRPTVSGEVGARGAAPVAGASRAAASEAGPVPALERDRFEFPGEFKARIEAHPPVVAGSVELLKDHYDLESGVFPVKLRWLDWVKPLLGEWFVSTAIFRADRDFARAAHEAGPTHPVSVRLRAEGDKAALAAVELVLLGRSVRLETGRGEPAASPARTAWKEPVTGMEFIRVEGGSYLMGAGDWDDQAHPHENPAHRVRLDGFWMGKHPVTQAQWEKVMGSNPSHFKFGGAHPVECVSWLDTKQFIKRLMALGDDLYAFRLPTEAEWEYACRSRGRLERYAGGSDEKDLDALGWHSGNSDGSSAPVGAKKPNALGLHDMSGNVWEWCEDKYGDTAYGHHEETNPVQLVGEPDRVIRGGSWYTAPRTARCCSRGFLDETFRRHFVGFRLVRTR